jgi:prefoldin subunit 5
MKDKGLSQLVQDLRQMRDKAESLSREQHELALQLKATFAAAQELLEKTAQKGGH